MRQGLTFSRKILILTTFTLSLSSGALGSAIPAAEQSAPSSAQSAATKATDSQTDEADQLITNRQLRAISGSLSRISMNTTWSYSAGAIDAPFNVVRPNITAAGDIATLQSLSGDVGLRYRLGTKDSVNFSIGLSMVAPFHYSLDTQNAALKSEYDQNAHKLTANDPTLTWRHLDKFSGIQSVTQASASLYTAAYRRNAGFQTGFVLSQTCMYEVGKSGLSFGAVVQGTLNTFSGEVDTGMRPGFILGFYPSIEYVISERLNLRTVSGVWVNEFRRNGTSFNRVVYQSVGVGISVTRDVFLYPNIQFLPGDLRADKTNLGFTANINLL